MTKDSQHTPSDHSPSPLGIIPEDWEHPEMKDFNQLSQLIQKIHGATQTETVKAINRMLTLRNWLIGYYIVEYEQKGNDRAKYGDKLLNALEKSLNTKGLTATLFYHAREFYTDYPQIKDYILSTISPTASVESTRRISPTVSDKLITPAEKLISQLSFSHIVEILAVKDALARYFYETECMRCNWSVRELRRQIATNLFVRAGVSKKPEELLKPLKRPERQIQDEIKQPFFFEFLGLKAQDVVEEKDLEQALIDHLQEFIMELGKGFCFEARQKRIIIDDEYYYADLVFYHRILHCNVIIELKNDEFHHEYLGQLNAYVSYYRENEMNDGDNPPVGILLCTKSGKKMVEYALAGMDNHLFVSTYKLQLPDESTLEEFLIRQTKEFE
jgi:predicted nuclease of restriction endonuclease-like (RecB) superfamily